MNILLSILIAVIIWIAFIAAALRFFSINADREEQDAEDAADSVRGKLNELEPRVIRVVRVRAGVNHE